jgi:hypothetical protein
MALFVIAYGIVVSLAVALIVGFSMYMVRDPPELGILLTDQYRNAREMLAIFYAGNSLERWGKRASRNLTAFKFPKESFEDALGIIRDNPDLNLSLTHHVSMLVLYVPKKHKYRIRSILDDSGIQEAHELSELCMWGSTFMKFKKSEEYGLTITDYKIIRDENSLEQLLKSFPLGSTLFSNPEGPILVLKSSDAGVMKTESIPSGFEARIIAGRDISALSQRRRGLTL